VQKRRTDAHTEPRPLIAERRAQQPRHVRSPTLDHADDGADDSFWNVSLAQLVSPSWDTIRLRLTESSVDSSQKLDPNTVACLVVVKSKGRRRSSKTLADDGVFKRGRAVNTTWGPCILKSKAAGGWNCDFRDDKPGGWYVEMKHFRVES
jgi:hypothetical protein